MANFPAAGYLSDAGRTKGEMKVAMEDQLLATKQIPGSGIAETTLTIAGGIVTPVGGVHAIDTESASVADDLATIATTNLPDGSMLWLRPVSAARVVTVKHNAGGAGQIAVKGAADLALTSPSLWLVLKRTGTDWEEVARFSATSVAPSYGASVVRGAVGAYASPTTYTVSSAALIVFVNPTTGVVTRRVANQGTLTVSTASQGRNGLDYATPVTGATWHYLYYTDDGTTPALRLSKNAPGTGPALANGETGAAFITALYITTGFRVTRLRGDRVDWSDQTIGQVLTAGNAGSYTAISLSAHVPPEGVCPEARITIAAGVNIAANSLVTVGIDLSLDGSTMWSIFALAGSSGVVADWILYPPAVPVPNWSQQIYYHRYGSNSPSSVYVLGYRTPNGG
jgi:hypothetical protein